MLRFPGLYIPPLPKKQADKAGLVMLRIFFLNRFVKQLTLCPYLLESKEFEVFLKQGINTETELTMMLKSYVDKKTPWHLDQLQPYYFIKGTFYDEEIESAKQEVKDFANKAKQVQSFLKNLLDFIIE